MTAIVLVGAASLYSVAGGSLDPWASRHVVRFCFGLALLFAVAFSDIRLWLRGAYPLYLAARIQKADSVARFVLKSTTAVYGSEHTDTRGIWGRVSRLVGRRVMVVQAVDEDSGRVRVGDSEWSARGGPDSPARLVSASLATVDRARAHPSRGPPINR